jgi:hypothetical protein
VISDAPNVTPTKFILWGEPPVIVSVVIIIVVSSLSLS